MALLLHAIWIGTALGILLPSAVDPDLWGHLLFGSMLLGGSIPATNGFSYTAAAHPWVNHELLAECSMAAVYHLGGGAGLVTMKVVIGLGTLLLVWRTAARRSNSGAASALATAVVAIVMAPGFMIRPQLFTLLFLAATLSVLARADYRPRGRAWWLPALMAVWVNTHGGVMAGVGVVALGLGGGLVARMRGRASHGRDVVAVLVLAAASGGALLLNPYGVELLRFLVHDVIPDVAITEWAPVPLADLSFLTFKALAAIIVVAVIRGRGVALPEALILAVTVVLAFRHQRHIPLFALAAGPLLASLLVEAWTALRGRLTARALLGLRAGAAIVAAAQIGVAINAGLETRGKIYVDPWAYPVQAMRFLAQNDIRGNVALPFRWSEYALWALPPGSRVAVDGRFTTAYPPGLLHQVWSFMRGAPGWEQLLDEYPTEIVVADRRQAPARLLRHADEWAYVYSDPISLVFVRRVSSQAAALGRLAAGTLEYDQRALSTDFPAAAWRRTTEPVPLLDRVLPHRLRRGSRATARGLNTAGNAASGWRQPERSPLSIWL